MAKCWITIETNALTSGLKTAVLSAASKMGVTLAKYETEGWLCKSTYIEANGTEVACQKFLALLKTFE